MHKDEAISKNILTILNNTSLCSWLRLLEQRLKFLLVDLLLLNKKCRTGMKHLQMLLNDRFCLLIALVNNTLYFAVNGICNLVSSPLPAW